MATQSGNGEVKRSSWFCGEGKRVVQMGQTAAQTDGSLEER